MYGTSREVEPRGRKLRPAMETAPNSGEAKAPSFPPTYATQTLADFHSLLHIHGRDHITVPQVSCGATFCSRTGQGWRTRRPAQPTEHAAGTKLRKRRGSAREAVKRSAVPQIGSDCTAQRRRCAAWPMHDGRSAGWPATATLQKRPTPPASSARSCRPRRRCTGS
eukprot:363464-Chlamydomonas_euryale.AAC.2